MSLLPFLGLFLGGQILAGGVACWRGPDGSGACPDSGQQLVEDLSKARQLWISEDRGCSIGYGAAGVAKGALPTFRSGYASPVAVDGRVYFAYFVPTGWDRAPGRDFTAADVAQSKQLAENFVGDDVVLCADAATGKTIWRQVFKGAAVHWKGLSKYGTHITPCVADGKVFALGSCGGIYGLDAQTGKVLWQGTVGKAAEQHRAGREKGELRGGRYHFSSCPTSAEGVAVFNDHAGSLLGIESTTGKELWRAAGMAGACTSPLRWPCKQRTYIVAQGKCLDPKTGKVLWKAPCGTVEGGSGSFAVAGEYMVTAGFFGGKAGATNGVSCFKISETRATPIWALPVEYRTGHSGALIYRDHAYFQTGTELVCVELKTGQVVAKQPVASKNPCQSPIACDGRIVLMNHLGVLKFTDGTNGMKPLGSPLAPAREWTITPYAADGKLFFRGPNWLYAYDLRAK